ncbi:MAG TPA: hypothetical protein VIR64_08090 [Pseudobacillus sp.]
MQLGSAYLMLVVANEALLLSSYPVAAARLSGISRHTCVAKIATLAVRLMSASLNSRFRF